MNMAWSEEFQAELFWDWMLSDCETRESVDAVTFTDADVEDVTENGDPEYKENVQWLTQ